MGATGTRTECDESELLRTGRSGTSFDVGPGELGFDQAAEAVHRESAGHGDPQHGQHPTMRSKSFEQRLCPDVGDDGGTKLATRD